MASTGDQRLLERAAARHSATHSRGRMDAVVTTSATPFPAPASRQNSPLSKATRDNRGKNFDVVHTG